MLGQCIAEQVGVIVVLPVLAVLMYLLMGDLCVG